MSTIFFCPFSLPLPVPTPLPSSPSFSFSHLLGDFGKRGSQRRPCNYRTFSFELPCARSRCFPFLFFYSSPHRRHFSFLRVLIDQQTLANAVPLSLPPPPVENRVCKDLVAHDHPGTNPFRQLIPLALDHPFLLHIVVATSALHLFNTLHCTKLTTAQPSLVASGSSRLGVAAGQLSKTTLTDALAAKHRAICSLRPALEDPDSGNREIILAAILFFINFELIDVGNDGWQPHLRGAGRVMALLSQAEASTNHKANRLLFDVVISDCLM